MSEIIKNNNIGFYLFLCQIYFRYNIVINFNANIIINFNVYEMVYSASL